MKEQREAVRNRPSVSNSQSDLPTNICRSAQPGHEGLIPLILAALGLVMLTSCAGSSALKGGKALTTHGAGGAIQQTLKQSDNPAQSSRQEQETIRIRTYTLPPGVRIDEAPFQALNMVALCTNAPAIVLNTPMSVSEREETRARTELGAAQKDTAREFGFKLASLRGITWVGLAMFLLGLACLVWPPLKAIVGSVTTSAALLLGGFILMVLPTLVVGNELLILGTVVLVVSAWFLAHRHGQLRGLLSGSTATAAGAEEISGLGRSLAPPLGPR